MRMTTNDLATIRAALRYWQEEMCPHPAVIHQPYFDVPGIEPLTAQAIERLRERLHPSAVRHVFWNPLTGALAGGELFASPDVIPPPSDPGLQVALVLLPLG